MKKLMLACLAVFLVLILLAGCGVSEPVSKGSQADTKAQIEVGNVLQVNQSTPTDIDYSLERYNLIKRAYWVNGQRERALSLPCELNRPLGYIVLFTSNGAIVGTYAVDGKVSSLNSYLTPDSEYYEQAYWSDGGSKYGVNKWLPDVDGSYGYNDNGIFFFTPDGKYIEWTGDYLYSDIPFKVEVPVLLIREGN